LFRDLPKSQRHLLLGALVTIVAAVNLLCPVIMVTSIDNKLQTYASKERLTDADLQTRARLHGSRDWWMSAEPGIFPIATSLLMVGVAFITYGAVTSFSGKRDRRSGGGYGQNI